VEPGHSAWRSYVRIAAVLRQRIADGRYPPGSLLPSEMMLAQEFRVVRNTVRRALAELAADNLIETVAGRGRVVRTAGDTAGTLLRYRQIASDLTAAISAGDLAAGDLLPSEATLVQRYGVSRGTVRRALAELESAGLVESRQGHGRRVRHV
jgi:DNA-binding GntR family transcriptional regulator